MKTHELVASLRQQAAKTTDPNTSGYLTTAADAITQMFDTNRKLAQDRDYLRCQITRIRTLATIREHQ